MEFIGNGVNKHSHIYFSTPSALAKNMLFYPIAVGSFYCNSDYYIQRDNYDSFLATIVVDGSLTVEQDGEKTVCNKNEIIFVDCYKPHKYYANDYAQTIWLHFDGNNSRQIIENLVAQKGKKIACTSSLTSYIFEIIAQIKHNCSEYQLSSTVYSFLCEICDCTTVKSVSEDSEQVKIAKKYINENYQSSLTVDDVARQVNICPSYFSKQFKNSTGMTPYDYILSIRLEKSKELLIQTDMPVGEIAYKTGFNSDANFIYFFKTQTGFSPLKFRNMQY